MKRDFVIAFTGHRPNRLPRDARGAVQDQIAALMGEILASSKGQARRPVLACALAEGADRMAAEAARDQGMSFRAVLPFPPGEYEKDFPDPESRAHFRALMAAAEGVEILPGDGGSRDAAYEAANLAILDDAAMLLAVWDGGPSAGRGGTAEMIDTARQRGVEVVVVDAAAQEPPRLLSSQGGVADAIAQAMAR